MKYKEWKISYARPEPPQELLDAGFSPLLAAELALRGITTAAEANAFINCGSEAWHEPGGIKDIDKAAQRLRLAIERGEKLAVFGDYDVDGITATCLMTDYLRSKGLECTSYIPDRAAEGYGLNRAALDCLKQDNVSLVITVDCGITAIEEVEHANSLGIDVIITDHHKCHDYGLPNAIAVVNCTQPGDNYPNKNLAGVGVALKLVCACEGESNTVLSQYADLVAVGTVADVMPLVGENRYLVRRGIEKLKKAPNLGLGAMLEVLGVDRAQVNSSTISYALAPRLNAAGRLGHSLTSVNFIMSKSRSDADNFGRELASLNTQRQEIEKSILAEAIDMLSDMDRDVPIVIADEHWHQGVIGIVASRLAELYSVPVIVISLNDELGKGSCRSYGSFNIFEALVACSEHLTGFGGHALAAGLNIERSRIDAFRAAMADYYRSHRPEPTPVVSCDHLICDPSLLSIRNINSLNLLEPYGNANPKPLMCICGARIDNINTVGNGKHLRFSVTSAGARFDCIYFSHTAADIPVGEGELVDIAFIPQINNYRGSSSVQLLTKNLRAHEPTELCERILAGDESVLWAARAYMPTRDDFANVWRYIKCGYFKFPDNIEQLLSQCRTGMPAERFCLCLRIMLDAGLIVPGADGSIYGASIAEIKEKVRLEDTRTYKALTGF